MRYSSNPDSRPNSMIDAFNLAGSTLCGADWRGTEAIAIRLGNRGGAARDIWERGKAIQKLLCNLVAQGQLPLEYYTHDGLIVRYHESPIRPVIWAIYPQPTKGSAGQIDFGAHGVFDCRIDQRKLQSLITKLTAPKQRKGRPRLYEALESACANYWRANASDTTPRAVIAHIRDQDIANLKWPNSESSVYRIIIRAREKVRAERFPLIDFRDILGAKTAP